jgi:hypothetical protein
MLLINLLSQDAEDIHPPPAPDLIGETSKHDRNNHNNKMSGNMK